MIARYEINHLNTIHSIIVCHNSKFSDTKHHSCKHTPARRVRADTKAHTGVFVVRTFMSNLASLFYSSHHFDSVAVSQSVNPLSRSLIFRLFTIPLSRTQGVPISPLPIPRSPILHISHSPGLSACRSVGLPLYPTPFILLPLPLLLCLCLSLLSHTHSLSFSPSFSSKIIAIFHRKSRTTYPSEYIDNKCSACPRSKLIIIMVRPNKIPLLATVWPLLGNTPGLACACLNHALGMIQPCGSRQTNFDVRNHFQRITLETSVHTEVL